MRPEGGVGVTLPRRNRRCSSWGLRAPAIKFAGLEAYLREEEEGNQRGRQGLFVAIAGDGMGKGLNGIKEGRFALSRANFPARGGRR
jgi:hypothetical protein